jgi:octanoyl-[GcvH]:protein N-octanoyltransferase
VISAVRDRHAAESKTEALKALAASDGWGWLRVRRPEPTAAFGRLDTLRPGYSRAAAAAEAHGFVPVVRAVGGRLAAYHEGALVLDIAARHPEPRRQITERFRQVGRAVADALAGLGLDARVGPVPGEYCAGEYSVNVAGRVKVAGTAQRLTSRALLFSAVVLVENPEPVRALLSEAYPLLELDWDPRSFGCVGDRLPETTTADVGEALLGELGRILSLGRGDDESFPLGRCWEVPL